MIRTFVLVLLVALAGCPADKSPPKTCAELGCGSAALCNRAGDCTCGGEACERELVDAGGP